VAAYDVPEWSDLFVATAGAAAALAGLVFVAVSINIERILKFEGLPERALEAVLTLVIVVLVSIACLIPGQSVAALGIELLLVAGGYSALVVRLWPHTRPQPDDPRTWIVSHVLIRVIAAVPLLVGAVSLIAESGGGVYWIVAGIVGAIIGAVANAWVLLVEILR
jgi:hypothetical protein